MLISLQLSVCGGFAGAVMLRPHPSLRCPPSPPPTTNESKTPHNILAVTDTDAHTQTHARAQGQTERQTDRQTDRHTYTQTHTHTHTRTHAHTHTQAVSQEIIKCRFSLYKIFFLSILIFFLYSCDKKITCCSTGICLWFFTESIK